MKLYVVPTPIGNLEDITLRALKVLQSVDFILCEDTRTTRNLLKHYEIDKRCVAYHIFNEHERLDAIIAQIKASESVVSLGELKGDALQCLRLVSYIGHCHLVRTSRTHTVDGEASGCVGHCSVTST